jgi:hypothetical protein
MKKNKRETHEGTCVGQSIGICGGSVELDGTNEMDGSNELLDIRVLDLLENFGVLSRDTLGDAGSVLDCCTLGA